MTKPLGPNQKLLLWLFGLGCLLALYFSPNLYGLYRFKAICGKEGGLRVYATLAVNELHLTEDGGGQYLSTFNGVRVGRSKDKKTGEWMDTKLVSARPLGPYSKYERSPSDLTQQPRYKWVWVDQKLTDELRLGRSGWEIYDLRTNALAVRYYTYGYHLFNPATVLLGAGPASDTCPELRGDTEGRAIESAFTNQQK